MNHNTSVAHSTNDRVLAGTLAALTMFICGYTATRVYLGQSGVQSAEPGVNVLPHSAELWSSLGR